MWEFVIFILIAGSTIFIFKDKIRKWAFIFHIVKAIATNSNIVEAYQENSPDFNIEKIGKYFYANYRYNMKDYKIIFPIKRGPCNILRVTSKNKDITSKFRTVLGPAYNFHGIPTTPKMLGINNKIEIAYIKGRIENYDVDDIISI